MQEHHTTLVAELLIWADVRKRVQYKRKGRECRPTSKIERNEFTDVKKKLNKHQFYAKHYQMHCFKFSSGYNAINSFTERIFKLV